MNLKFLLWLLIIPGLVLAREYRPHDLRDRIGGSDFIALVKVTSIDNEFSPKPRMLQIYATADVVRTIKGDVGGSIKFMTHGLIPEFNPSCCTIGKEYLIFGKYGYPVFGVDDDGMDKIFMHEKNNFTSSADGPYGAFLVENGTVRGWDPGGSDKPLNEVIEQIKAFLKK